MPMTVCQVCGDKGEIKLLFYCVKCQDSAVHHYCLDKFSPDDEYVNWMCVECAPVAAKVVSPRKSERTPPKVRAFDARNRKKKLNTNSSLTSKRAVYMDRLAETAQLPSDGSVPCEEMKNLHSVDETRGNPGLRKHRRRFILEDGDCGDSSLEEFESNKTAASSLPPPEHYGLMNDSYGQRSLESHELVQAQPIMDPIWRGSFRIANTKDKTLVGLMAHLSTKACSKVSDAAALLPKKVDVDILPICDAWPKSFKELPPADDSIALYFFPEYERDEKVFDWLLNKIIEQDLSLKADINDVELLVFSSLELPQEHWRYCRKYYMWGVFKKKQIRPKIPDK